MSFSEGEEEYDQDHGQVARTSGWSDILQSQGDSDYEDQGAYDDQEQDADYYTSPKMIRPRQYSPAPVPRQYGNPNARGSFGGYQRQAQDPMSYEGPLEGSDPMQRHITPTPTPIQRQVQNREYAPSRQSGYVPQRQVASTPIQNHSVNYGSQRQVASTPSSAPHYVPQRYATQNQVPVSYVPQQQTTQNQAPQRQALQTQAPATSYTPQRQALQTQVPVRKSVSVDNQKTTEYSANPFANIDTDAQRNNTEYPAPSNPFANIHSESQRTSAEYTNNPFVNTRLSAQGGYSRTPSSNSQRGYGFPKQGDY